MSKPNWNQEAICSELGSDTESFLARVRRVGSGFASARFNVMFAPLQSGISGQLPVSLAAREPDRREALY